MKGEGRDRRREKENEKMVRKMTAEAWREDTWRADWSMERKGEEDEGVRTRGEG